MTNATDPRPTTYAEADAILDGKTERRIGHNTTLRLWDHYPDGGGESSIAVIFHKTHIAVFSSEGYTTLRSDGFQTATTKERINRYLPKGVGLYQKDWTWYVSTPNDDDREFCEGFMIQSVQ